MLTKALPFVLQRGPPLLAGTTEWGVRLEEPDQGGSCLKTVSHLIIYAKLLWHDLI